VAEEPPSTNILAYAGDIARIAQSEKDLQEYMTKWYNTFTKFGITLNIKN
jgi:hypothetical protein